MTTGKKLAILGVFRGFSPGCLYKLSDGSFWRQTGNSTSVDHVLDPGAEILALDDGQFLRIEGIDTLAEVTRLHDVIESQIRGRFSGWNGRSVYTLTNGQRWQQAKFKQKHVVKYMPQVLIYHDGRSHIMQVAGTQARVRRLG